jgi:murein DD-endopeptidase MepM/ murein hydrolase activator NlpD
MSMGMFLILFIALVATAAMNTSSSLFLDQGRALTAAFYNNGIEVMWSRFSEKMRQALGNANRLAEFRTQIEDELGIEQSVDRETVQAKDGRHIYLRIARFSKETGPVMVQWVFGSDETVQGFVVRKVPEEAASERFDYVPKVDLRLPFAGSWFVAWGGRTLPQNQHAATVDQRFAYDLLIQREGRTHAGAGVRNEDYYCFDQSIMAPASGTVVSAENEVEDNIPGVTNSKQPLGNHVIIDHGNGEFSFLCHFRKGTVTVKKGDPVKAGDLLGRCGNSGFSTEAHLHYHLQDTAVPFNGQGLPAPFQKYLADGKLVERGEPVKGQIVEAP